MECGEEQALFKEDFEFQMTSVGCSDYNIFIIVMCVKSKCDM